MINKEKAIILTLDAYDKLDAKTAHGLIRGTKRFDILAVVDSKNYGYDAGEKLDGTHRHIPIIESVKEAIQLFPEATVAIIGIATHGGVIPKDLEFILLECLENGLSLVNGLHEFLSDKLHFVELAMQNKVYLKDVRKPKTKDNLHFWTGRIHQVKCPVIAVIGTDCAVGKRTSARFLTDLLNENNKNAAMIYTGQTGWLQGGEYGFIFDSTLNDFVSGELENAIVECYLKENPDFIFLEGQSALRNPSGPCGSEFFVSGKAKYAVLVHPPKRVYYDDDAHWGEIPSVESEIALVNAYGAEVIAVVLNTQGCSMEESKAFQEDYYEKLKIPVLLPIEEGVNFILPVFLAL
ncbi:MAG: DUF1611 domain-containing protein [Haliscomenobacter sp.]|nr:DUF1611 domain-containing protein [Haliscomenobacter sp.]